jgi:2-haloacid dehalogenase
MTRWVVFDLNGTLLDASAIGAAALDRAILAGMTLNHVDEYRPFTELLAAGGADGAAPMPAFPEAASALDLLAAAGLSLAVLTNSPTDAAERRLRDAGLRERLAHVIGTDQVGVFKPDARVYRHGLAVLGAAPGDATMVAAHWWDLRGARAVGLRVAWVGRGEGTLSPLLAEPDAQGADLLATATAIVDGLRAEEAR